jgi:hypothetical protein
MAQYPQGIFQTIKWLMRKVRILALGRIPVYNLGTLNTNYTIQGRGLYTVIGGTGAVFFPNPALYQGQTIIVSNISPTFNIQVGLNAYTPNDINGGVYFTFMTNTTYEFISNGTSWVGGSFA